MSLFYSEWEEENLCAIASYRYASVSLSCHVQSTILSLMTLQSDVVAQGSHCFSPDPSPRRGWGLGTRLAGNNYNDYLLLNAHHARYC